MAEIKAPSNINFALLAQQHSITLADQKSGLLLAATVVLLTFMAREASVEGAVPDWAAIAAAALLFVTAGLNLATIAPTLLKEKGLALSFWRSSLFDLDKEAFVQKTLSKDFEDGHAREDVLHLRALALVARRKYRLLRLAFVTGGAGILAFLWWRLMI